MHQIDAYETGKSERAFYGGLCFLCHLQQQIGNQGDGDLDAYGILTAAQEMLNPQGLFDPLEEQFDGPAALIQIRDLLRRRFEIVGEDAQDLTCISPYRDLAHQLEEGVEAAGRLAQGQLAGAVREDIAALGTLVFGEDFKGRILLEAGDDTAVCLVQLGPSAVVIVAKIKDIGRARLDRHGFGGGDIVDPGCRNSRVDRPFAVGVIDDMGLDATGPVGEMGPVIPHAA